jgi:hypothetical protein
MIGSSSCICGNGNLGTIELAALNWSKADGSNLVESNIFGARLIVDLPDGRFDPFMYA